MFIDLQRPLQIGTFRSLALICPISAFCLNLNPQNTQCIPRLIRLRRIAFLELEQISADFGNYLFLKVSCFKSLLQKYLKNQSFQLKRVNSKGGINVC